MDVALIGMGMVAQTRLPALRDNMASLRPCTIVGRDAERADALQGDSLHIDWHDGRQVRMDPEAASGTGGGTDPMAFSHGWYQSMIEDFAQAIRNRTPPIATPRRALHVHAVIHTMEQAARSGHITDIPA